MKYIISLCILLIIGQGFKSNLYSQVSIGIMGGVTSINLVGDPVAINVYNPHVGWNASSVIDIDLAHDVFISIRPGVIYGYGRVQTTDTIDLPFNKQLIYRDSVNISIGSFNTPILLKVITDNERFQFTSGIEIGYLVQATWNNGNEKIDIRSHLKNFNSSITFGLGYRLPVKQSWIAFELSYSQGIVNQSRPEIDIELLNRLKTSSLRLTVAWTFPVSKKEGKNE